MIQGESCRDYIIISTPATPNQIIASIGEHIGEPNAQVDVFLEQTDRVLSFPLYPLEICASARVLVSGECEVETTSTEHDILRFLASNPDVFIPRPVVIQKFFGLVNEKSSRTLYTHTYNLRKKLELLNIPPPLHSQYGSIAFFSKPSN